MRITLVSAFDPSPSSVGDAQGQVGGVERVFAQVSRALARRGHDVTLVCSTAGAAGTSTEAGVRLVREPRRMTVLRAPIAALARSIPHDSELVHVAATYPFTTMGVLRRAHALGIPSVLDFHFEPDPPGVIGRLAAALYLRRVPAAYRLAASVLVRSMAYGRSAPSLETVAQRRWRVVPNGIDPHMFRPEPAASRPASASHGPTPSAPGSPPSGSPAACYLLFVGRLVPYKGLDVLLRALAMAPPGLPLRIVGDGPLRRPLEALAADLGVDVQFLGRVPDQDLPALYRGAALTLLPSVSGQECFGISILESMACGTPVVASDLPGVADLALLGGLVARRGDAQHLGSQIRAALDGPMPRGQVLADRIHAEFSWDRVATRLEAVYEEVVSGRRQRR